MIGRILIIETATLDTVMDIAHDGRWVQAMRFSPDGRYLAAGGHDTNIRVYDTTTYRLVSRDTRRCMDTHVHCRTDTLAFSQASRDWRCPQ